MNFNKYVDFIRNFLAEEVEDKKPYGTALTDRFTGGEKEYLFNTLPERRFLQLSSVKYLLSNSPYEQPFQDQDISGLTPGLFKKVYDDEIKIYEFSDVLPRAWYFTRPNYWNRTT